MLAPVSGRTPVERQQRRGGTLGEVEAVQQIVRRAVARRQRWQVGQRIFVVPLCFPSFIRIGSIKFVGSNEERQGHRKRGAESLRFTFRLNHAAM